MVNQSMNNLARFGLKPNMVNLDLKIGDNFVPIVASKYNGLIFPKRLEPRTSLTFYFAARTDEELDFSIVKSAYAVTACGRTFNGNSDFLKSLIKKSASASSAK